MAAEEEPARQIAFGAAPGTRGGQTRIQGAQALEAAIGRKLATVRVFLTWDDPFPDDYTQWIVDGGRGLILSVKPTRANGSRISWATIANAAPGSMIDGEMREWALKIKDLGVPIYVTFNHEPEAAANDSRGTSTDYIAAWRRWVSVFREEGASNARFMFITTAFNYTVSPTSRRYVPKWYPGDEWVDALAADGYNWFGCNSGSGATWSSLQKVIEAFRQFGALHPDKAMWMAEWASTIDPNQPGRKATWIADVERLFQQPGYEQFQGVSYFYVGSAGASCTWRMDTDAASMAAFRTMANNPFYLGTTFGEVTPPPPPNVLPTAVAGAECSASSCTFSSTGSDDPDGTIEDYDWDFGDQTSGSGETVQHNYTSGGTFTATLTVTDDRGGQATDTVEVEVTAPPAPDLDFVAAQSALTNSTLVRVTAPGSVQAGDTLVLFATSNITGTLSAPAGWTQATTANDSTMTTRAWVRTATAADANSVVTVNSSAMAKLDAQLLVYRGADANPLASAAGRAEPGIVAAHTTPAAAGTPAGSRVVSYWADKTPAGTGWTVPGSVTLRRQSIGGGSGRITSATADAVSPGGAVAGVTATASSASDKATMLTVVLRPAP